MMMSSLIIGVSLLIFGMLGMTCYRFFIQKKPIEHYYTPLDRVLGQTPVEFHEQKIEKKESEEEEGDDKDKNEKIRQKRQS
ncbi:DUF3951 domain-containing protein [Brevibacillus porteri]|uniref:DUF3951 domain-containing protein n=1 Tax=Brevibacillus porteri TaxID=2126350 RepID=UPI003D24BCA5